MDVRVVVEVLAPGVQDGGDADVGAEMLGIGGDRRQRLGRRREQQAVDLGLVLVGDGADRGRQREHDVEVGNRQQLRLACRKPRLRRPPLALGTVAVAAGVIGDARVRAVIAALDMTAERRGAADLDRRHDAPLAEAQMRLVRGTPCAHRSGGRRPPPPASDATWPAGQAGAVSSMFKQLERALDLSDRVERNASVSRRRGDMPMPQQILDDADIDALLQQMRGKAMAKRVHSAPSSRGLRIGRLATSALHGAAGDRALVILTGEEAGAGGLVRLK